MAYSLLVQLSERKEAPSELRLFAAGENQTLKGSFFFDATSAKEVLASYQAHGAKLSFDYGHAMLDRNPVDPSKSGKSAGKFELAIRNGELWAVNIKWTPAAKQAIEDGEWMYVSPAFKADESNRIMRLVNCALTNLPATDNAMPLTTLAAWDAAYVDSLPDSAFLFVDAEGARYFPVLDVDGKVDQAQVEKAIAEIAQSEAPGLDKEACLAKAQALLPTAEEMVAPVVAPDPKAEVPAAEAGVCPTCGQKMPDGEEPKVEVEVNACKPDAKKMSQDVPAWIVALDCKDEPEAMALVVGLKAKVTRLTAAEANVVELSAKYESLERTVLLKDNASKIPGNLAKWAETQSTESLKAFFASAPEIVPTTLAAQPKVERAVVLTDEERTIARALGLSEEKALTFKSRK
jgi:phage I-like protein